MFWHQTSRTSAGIAPSPCHPLPPHRPPKGWASEHRANDKMTPWQWATAPWKMVQWGRRRYDVHLMYLPSPLLRRIKQAITQGALVWRKRGVRQIGSS